MKLVKHLIPAFLLFALLLTSRSATAERDTAPPDWEEDWTAVGGVAAAEPLDGFTPAENLDIMSGSGLWYAAWTYGEGERIENDSGQEAMLYDAQIYLIIKKCDSDVKALAEIGSWQDQEGENYDCSEPVSQEHGGVRYQVMTLTAPSDNPFDGGISAVTSIGKYAVSVELMYREVFPDMAGDTADTFLDGLHFNFEEE